MDENNLNNLGFDPNSNNFNQQSNLDSFQPNSQFPNDQSFGYDPFGNPINTQDINDYSNSTGPVSYQELNYNSQNTQPIDSYNQPSFDQPTSAAGPIDQNTVNNQFPDDQFAFDDNSFQTQDVSSEFPMNNDFAQDSVNPVPVDNNFVQDPMNQMAMDDILTQDPMESQMPMNGGVAQDPMSQMPMDDNFAEEPMVSQVPMDDGFAQESMDQMPMDDNFTEEPMINQAPMNDSLAQEPTSQIPVDDSFAQEPMNQIPMDNNYVQDSLMNQMPMDNNYGQDPMMNQMPMDNNYGQDPLMNQMPMDNNYGQDPMMNQMPMDNNYGLDPMMNQMPMDNNYGQAPMMNQMPMDTGTYSDFPGSNVNDQYLSSNNLVDNPATQGPYVEHTDPNSMTGDVPRDYAQAYMTTIYDKVNANKFNWPAVLLGSAYYMFRKNFLSGLLFAILQCLVSILIVVLAYNISDSSPVGFIISGIWCLASNIGFGFLFNRVYRGRLNNLFEKDQRIEYAQKNGGTSIVGLIIGFVLNGALSSLAFAVFSLIGVTSILSGGAGGRIVEPDNPSAYQNIIYQNTVDDNTVEEPVSMAITYKFDQYQISYDNGKWSHMAVDDGTKEYYYLTNIDDNSKLTYFGMNSAADVASYGDISTEEGRKSVYELFGSLVPQTFYPDNTDSISITTPKISETNESLNEPTFIKKGNVYIGRLDATDANSITRYYFVIPSDLNVIMIFYLSQINSLEVSSELDTSVEELLVSIKLAEEDEESEDENITTNSISEDNTIAENALDNATANETSDETNETNQTNETNETNTNENAARIEQLTPTANN